MKAARKKPADPADAFCAAAQEALKKGDLDRISDESLRRVMSAAVIPSTVMSVESNHS